VYAIDRGHSLWADEEETYNLIKKEGLDHAAVKTLVFSDTTCKLRILMERFL
jgi:hypothetical protein